MLLNRNFHVLKNFMDNKSFLSYLKRNTSLDHVSWCRSLVVWFYHDFQYFIYQKKNNNKNFGLRSETGHIFPSTLLSHSVWPQSSAHSRDKIDLILCGPRAFCRPGGVRCQFYPFLACAGIRHQAGGGRGEDGCTSARWLVLVGRVVMFCHVTLRKQ